MLLIDLLGVCLLFIVLLFLLFAPPAGGPLAGGGRSRQDAAETRRPPERGVRRGGFREKAAFHKCLSLLAFCVLSC